jgi:hypothetical protein
LSFRLAITAPAAASAMNSSFFTVEPLVLDNVLPPSDGGAA